MIVLKVVRTDYREEEIATLAGEDQHGMQTTDAISAAATSHAAKDIAECRSGGDNNVVTARDPAYSFPLRGSTLQTPVRADPLVTKAAFGRTPLLSLTRSSRAIITM